MSARIGKTTTNSTQIGVLLFLIGTVIFLGNPHCCDATDTVLVPAGSIWKYLDNGSDQGTAWRGISFNDSTWSSGPAQLGYGDGDESTIVSYGPNANNKYITTYFRHSFSVANPSLYAGLTLRLLRDDGAVVYLNGTEAARSNMPSGPITYTTSASTPLGSPEENTFQTIGLNPSYLISGTNVIAVEIHQSSGTSSDISFDLELIASDSVTVVRGPYLQIATPNGITVRWRTGAPSDSRVRYGLDPQNLTGFVDDNTQTTEHVVNLSGLLPASRYYYSIGTTTTVLAGDSGYFFVTPPLAGTAQNTRIWVIGDSGTANANAAAVRDAYLGFNGSQDTHLWLMLGDNAYDSGTDTEYQAAVFDMYPSLLRQSSLWPTLGNHDGATANSSNQSGPYYDIFTLPRQAEAGGLASGTEAYYSFDYANIHFICLESFETDRSVSGPMMTWLQNDVNSTGREWIIAFWHHPPYSKGSHNSDTETELIQMRENALPILEQAGVDLVLTGHSHSYERSYLIDGHYSTSGTFNNSHKKDGGSGREDDTGAYLKPGSAPSPHEGAVYAVAGSSGKTSGGTLNHPAMFISLNSLGSMVLDVNGNRMDAKFLDHTGIVRDYFTIIKGGSAPNPPGNLNATAVSSSQINLTWNDNSANEDSFEVERSPDGNTFSLLATVGENITAYSDTGLPSATTRYYRVRAVNSSGASGYSNTADATTFGDPPAAPGSLIANQVSKNKIELFWTDHSSNEQGFEIERSEDGIGFSQIDVVGQNVTYYLNTGLRQNRTYYYRVRAFNSFGNSAYSNIAAPGQGSPPTAPSGLNAVAAGSSQIDLSWIDNSGNETGFRIQRSTDGNNFAQIATVGADITVYSDTGLPSGTTFYYRVAAYNTAGDSAYSNTANATTGGTPPPIPNAPSNLTATNTSKNKITLTWTDNSINESGFRIERSEDGVSFSEIATTGADVTSYVHSGKPNQIYYFRVRAYNSSGNSDYSNVANN